MFFSLSMKQQYDLRAALNDNEAQLKIEKEGIAREMHSLLMGYVTVLAFLQSFGAYSIHEITGLTTSCALCLLFDYCFIKINSIPVEDLASNGESVRAKVFHIVTTLCTQVPATDLNYDLVRDWCNMVRFYFSPSLPSESLDMSNMPTKKCSVLTFLFHPYFIVSCLWKCSSSL